MKPSSIYVTVSMILLSGFTIYHLWGIGGILALALWFIGLFAIVYNEFKLYTEELKRAKAIYQDAIERSLQENREKKETLH